MTTLTQKCQVTIPKQFRVAIGLRSGDDVEFELSRDKNKLLLRKKPKRIPFEKWRGYLGTFDSDKALAELRG